MTQSARPATVFGSFRKDPGRLQALGRIEEQTRARFGLPRTAAVIVSEITCSLPGCPPLETVVVFWTDDAAHRFKIFKPAHEVIADDLPYVWLKPALVVPAGFAEECC